MAAARSSSIRSRDTAWAARTNVSQSSASVGLTSSTKSWTATRNTGFRQPGRKAQLGQHARDVKVQIGCGRSQFAASGEQPPPPRRQHFRAQAAAGDDRRHPPRLEIERPRRIAKHHQLAQRKRRVDAFGLVGQHPPHRSPAPAVHADLLTQRVERLGSGAKCRHAGPTCVDGRGDAVARHVIEGERVHQRVADGKGFALAPTGAWALRAYDRPSAGAARAAPAPPRGRATILRRATAHRRRPRVSAAPKACAGEAWCPWYRSRSRGDARRHPPKSRAVRIPETDGIRQRQEGAGRELVGCLA